jgi:hypothetical protein
MLANSDRELEHVVDLHKACALTAQWHAEAAVFARNYWIKSETTKTSSRGSQQEIKLGFTVVTQKLNSSPLSRKVHHLHTRRTWGKSGQTSRAGWRSFLTVSALFIRNLYLQAKWLTSNTSRSFINDWGSKSARHILNNGRTKTGQFILTTYQCTLPCQCRNFWLLKTWRWSPPFLLLWLVLCDYFCFREKNHS